MYVDWCRPDVRLWVTGSASIAPDVTFFEEAFN